jgi:N6-adenosine-specific RNA methylase IME4
VVRLREAEKALQQAVNVHQAKLIADVASAQEVFAHRQKLGDDIIGYAHQIKIYALARLGDLLQQMSKASGGKRPKGSSGAKGRISSAIKEPLIATLADLGLDKKTSAIAQQLAKLDQSTRQAIADREQTLSGAIQESNRKEIRAKLDDVAAREIEAPTGLYDCIVIDPPWPMDKIERDERPNQVEFSYPTMPEDDLRELVIPCATDCHVWVWTTQRFLPMAFRLLSAWQLNYICTFVWHKSGGFQPYGLPQFNCEFALYARRGAPVFLDTKAFPVCFDAPRGEHSKKPDAFYDVVRRVTAGRRLDMYNRREIEGFVGWGKEAA